MELPTLLLALLALPLAVAAVIVAVSSGRRRRHDAGRQDPVHRLQADTAAVQSAAVHAAPAPRQVVPARERRAASSPEQPGRSSRPTSGTHPA